MNKDWTFTYFQPLNVSLSSRQYKKFLKIVWGFQASSIVHVANSFDIFTKLSHQQPASAEDIARWCQADVKLTEKLLIACISLGLLERDDGLYRNTPFSERYLVCDSPFYQGHLVKLASNVAEYFCKIEEIIRSGEKKPIWRTEDKWTDFILGMHQRGTGKVLQWLLSNIDLTGKTKLLDVGGGTGVYSIGLCKEYPALYAVIFDLPKTFSITQNIIKQSGIAERIKLQSGDWMQDEFGNGFDVAILSQILYEQKDIEIMKLKKIYNAMTSGGLIVIQEFLLDDDKSGPPFPAFFNLMLETHSVSEILDYLSESGFVNGKLVSTGFQELRIITAEKL